MPTYIAFVFEEDGIVARAELLEKQAPKTCELVRNLLPVTGFFHHGIYSGPEVAMVLPKYVVVEPENATTAVLPWEIGFASLLSRDYIDVPHDFSEVCFFYDRGARPSMADGLGKVNIFARFVSGQEELYALCYRIRTEGQKRVTIRNVTGED